MDFETINNGHSIFRLTQPDQQDASPQTTPRGEEESEVKSRSDPARTYRLLLANVRSGTGHEMKWDSGRTSSRKSAETSVPKSLRDLLHHNIPSVAHDRQMSSELTGCNMQDSSRMSGRGLSFAHSVVRCAQTQLEFIDKVCQMSNV